MATFDYRRELTREETLRSLVAGAGIGVAAGLAGAYLARVLMQRTPVASGEPRAAPPADALMPPRPPRPRRR